MTQQNLAVSNEFNTKLESLHLDSVAQDLANTQGWTSYRTKWAIAGYKRYLSLMHQNPSQVFVPTGEIDEVLHAHIALGAQFHEDCQLLFGRALQHEAGSGKGNDVEQQVWLATFQQTKKLFKQMFGVTLTEDPAHCYTSFLGSPS